MFSPPHGSNITIYDEDGCQEVRVIGRPRIVWVISGGLAGFLITILPVHLLLLRALVSTFRILGGPSADITLRTWLILGAIPLMLAIAAALPALSLGASKALSLFAGCGGGVLAVLVFVIAGMIHGQFWLFGPSDTLASITPIIVSVLAASLYPIDGRETRIPVVLAASAALFILAVVVTSIIAYMATSAYDLVLGIPEILLVAPPLLTILLAWVVLPLAALLHQQVSSHVRSYFSAPDG